MDEACFKLGMEINKFSPMSGERQHLEGTQVKCIQGDWRHGHH